MAAPLPDIITIVRGLPHDGDRDRSSATGDLANREPDRAITVGGLKDRIVLKQALAPA